MDWSTFEAGVRAVDVPAAVHDAALANLRAWLTDPAYEAYRPTIEGMARHGAFDELVDAFWRVLPFGTGGRRGAVGVGPNRLNPVTVSTSVQGHAAWLRARHEGELHVVIAYDVRCFRDARGVLPADVEVPVMGWTSRRFAELAASVYAANDVIAHLLPADADYFLSTPELSFTIRALGAVGGLNVSASHNPPDDNGVKVYDGRGAQLVPPDDESLLDEVARWSEARTLPLEEAAAAGRVRWLSASHHHDYIAAVAALAGDGPRGLGVAYTPLHGTGVVHEVLRAAGFDCALHGPQAAPDGAFPTVPGAVANPERPEAMAHALEALDVALVFGTDPDADRLGCEVRHDGGWVHLTGNDIGALLVYQAARHAPAGKRPLVIKTEVTSSLVQRVAEAEGAVVVGDLLVGFKYIGQVLAILEDEGEYRGVSAADVAFVAGVEESHGVLVTPVMRDKDAAGGALLLAELAAEEATQGRTLVDRLLALKQAHGDVRNHQISVRFEGATGAARMAERLAGLRGAPPTSLGDRTVRTWTDHQDPSGRFGAVVSGSDRASRNVLVAELSAGPGDDGARVVFRPSGTEPKLKVYLELRGRPGADPAAIEALGGAMNDLIAAVRSSWLG